MLWGNEEEERWEQHYLYDVAVQAESPGPWVRNLRGGKSTGSLAWEPRTCLVLLGGEDKAAPPDSV